MALVGFGSDVITSVVVGGSALRLRLVRRSAPGYGELHPRQQVNFGKVIGYVILLPPQLMVTLCKRKRDK
jgi:hypothetical protein